jgi:hypothetical protein
MANKIKVPTTTSGSVKSSQGRGGKLPKVSKSKDLRQGK